MRLALAPFVLGPLERVRGPLNPYDEFHINSIILAFVSIAFIHAHLWGRWIALGGGHDRGPPFNYYHATSA